MAGIIAVPQGTILSFEEAERGRITIKEVFQLSLPCYKIKMGGQITKDSGDTREITTTGTDDVPVVDSDVRNITVQDHTGSIDCDLFQHPSYAEGFANAKIKMDDYVILGNMYRPKPSIQHCEERLFNDRWDFDSYILKRLGGEGNYSYEVMYYPPGKAWSE